MPEVNTEEIMNEIKKKVEERGLTDDVLSFDDIEAEDIEEDMGGFIDQDDFEMNCEYEINRLQAFTELSRQSSRLPAAVNYGNNFKYFIKRVLRKIKSFFTFRKRQEAFDLNVAKSLNQVEKFISEEYKYEIPGNSKLMNKKEEWEYYDNYDRIIGDLQNKIASLEVEIQKLKDDNNAK